MKRGYLRRGQCDQQASYFEIFDNLHPVRDIKVKMPRIKVHPGWPIYREVFHNEAEDPSSKVHI